MKHLKTLWAWIWALRVPDKRVEVIKRDISKLTLQEFRSNARLTSGAAATLSADFAVIMMQVLKNMHPGATLVMPSADLQTRAVAQARAEGYTLAIANLESMAIFKQTETPIEATYASDN
jgi:xanthine dehydrogenase iron-sulfur cluster and FAD-binding subunit A